MREVRFPDGTIVRGAALPERDQNEDWRERGIYLDARWAPSWPADVVDWPDLGVPTDDAAAAAAIERAFRAARDGVHVEVGCAGGRGRTGTVLACMAVLAGVPSGRAVAWVREHYSPHAVETSAQQRWVATFAQHAAQQGWPPHRRGPLTE